MAKFDGIVEKRLLTVTEKENEVTLVFEDNRFLFVSLKDGKLALRERPRVAGARPLESVSLSLFLSRVSCSCGQFDSLRGIPDLSSVSRSMPFPLIESLAIAAFIEATVRSLASFSESPAL